MWAGYYEPRTVVVFVGTKIALAALLGSAYFLYSSFVFLRVVPFTQLLAISLVLAGIGFFLPDFRRILRESTDKKTRLPPGSDISPGRLLRPLHAGGRRSPSRRA